MGLPPDLTWGGGNHRGRGGGTPSWGEATQHPKKRTHLRWEIRGHPEGGRFHRTTATSFRPQRSGGGGQTSGCLPAAGLETTFSLSLWVKQVEWEGIRVPPHPTDIFLQGRGSQPVEGARAVIWDNQTKQGGCLVWKQGGCLESIPGIKQGTFSGESKPVGCSPTGASVLLWACLPPHRVGGWVTTGVGGSLAGAGLGVFFCVE